MCAYVCAFRFSINTKITEESNEQQNEEEENDGETLDNREGCGGDSGKYSPISPEDVMEFLCLKFYKIFQAHIEFSTLEFVTHARRLAVIGQYHKYNYNFPLVCWGGGRAVRVVRWCGWSVARWACTVAFNVPKRFEDLKENSGKNR